MESWEPFGLCRGRVLLLSLFFFDFVTGTKATDGTSENPTSEVTSSKDKITCLPRNASKDPEECSRPVTVKNETFEASSSKEEVTSVPEFGTIEKNLSKSLVVKNRTCKV